MCGRFTSTTSAADLAAHFAAERDGIEELPPDFNVTPSSDCYVVLEGEGRRRLDVLRWGLVPAWADDPTIASRLINARSETAAAKPSFRSAFRTRRCLVPVDGFYEWAPVPGSRRKRPHHFRSRDGRPLAFAGLWESWRPKDDPSAMALRTFTILTGPPNATVAPIHDRMPVILAADEWSTWLDPTCSDRDLLQSMLDPAPDDLLDRWPVSLDVNDVRRHDPALIERAADDDDGRTDDADDGQGRLF